MTRTAAGPLTRYRLLAVAALGVVAVLVGLLLFGNLNRNLVYYLTPGEAVAQRSEFSDGRRFQLGGLVQERSVVPSADGVRFVVTGTEPGGATVPVDYRGVPAQLFAEGIGVVLEGSWRGDEFAADTMKVKHDENYRPPEGEAT
ncbi:cytochrome c maturation protein CcmE [Pseudonocardia nigra]|uniref:cytochrome c maturation protein CcmE n=1 Tax=Pseudonocardia nigra TaxID=1921578 RepID=UPI0027E33AB6|nr:cytochrome c maturation protein CcmE [Pseudonocardia nigra]